MNVLVVEDNDYKRNKIIDYIIKNHPSYSFFVSRSYSSAIQELSSKEINFAIIDMSIPTFDNELGNPAGEFRTFGGMDIAKYISRKKLAVQYIFLTQYVSFASDDKNYDLANIEKQAFENYSGSFLGCIFYDNSSLAWTIKLKEIMQSK